MTYRQSGDNAASVDRSDGWIGRGENQRRIVGIPGKNRRPQLRRLPAIDRDVVVINRDALHRVAVLTESRARFALDTDLIKRDIRKPGNLLEHFRIRTQRQIPSRQINEAGILLRHPVVGILNQPKFVVRPVFVRRRTARDHRIVDHIPLKRIRVRVITVFREEISQFRVFRQIRRPYEIVVGRKQSQPLRHVILRHLIVRIIAQKQIRVIIRHLTVHKNIVARQNVGSPVVLNRRIAHFIENVLVDRQPHRKIVGIYAFNPGFRFPDMMEIIAPDHGSALLRRFAGVHVDRAEVGERFAYIVNVVVFHHMVVAKNQHPGMRRVMQFVVLHPIAHARQQNAGIIGLVIIGKIVDMGIFHDVSAWRERRFVAARQGHGRPADMMDMRVFDRVVCAGDAVEVVVIEPALRVHQDAAVGKVADFAVLDLHMAAAHEHRRRIAAVLQDQLGEVDVRSVQRIDHRRFQHRDFNRRIGHHKFRIRQKI
ncbi:hypothetical protein D3C74_278500 [compost metagenome]